MGLLMTRPIRARTQSAACTGVVWPIIYFDWGKLYLTQYREYSHKSKYYCPVTLDLCAVGLAIFLLFHLIIEVQAPILMIAWYVLGQLYFMTLQGYNKGK
jgi:hypothetical protein